MLTIILGLIGFAGAATWMSQTAGLETIKVVCGIAGFVISLPLSYFTFRWVVSEFVVKEMAKTSPPVPAEPPQV